MFKKSISLIAACVAITLLVVVECLENQNREVVCLNIPTRYVQFPVRAYYSSRTMKNVLLGKNTVLGENFDFDPNRRTAVIFHGFIGRPLEDNMNYIRDALLIWQDMNIFVIDYHEGAQYVPLYPQAVANTQWAAKGVYDLFARLANMVNKPVKDWKPIHFIGYSLGVHVAGQAAALLQRELNWTIDRITGLDPAETCFGEDNLHLRLKKSDARFVDVIHTDGALKKNERFGYLEPLGHADFYVNGGSTQPGCASPFYNDQVKLNIGDEKLPPLQELFASLFNIIKHVTLENGLCHHDRSIKLFLESLIQAKYQKCKFWAHPWRLGTDQSETTRILSEKCNGNHCIEMGINAELYDPKDATYYVKTNDKLLYCQN